jgi:hypothetical protein
MNPAVYFAAMWVSEIWYRGYETRNRISDRHANFCRAMGIVKFDRIITGKLVIEP